MTNKPVFLISFKNLKQGVTLHFELYINIKLNLKQIYSKSPITIY